MAECYSNLDKLAAVASYIYENEFSSAKTNNNVSIGSNEFGNHDTKSSSPAQLVDKSSELVDDSLSKFYASQCYIQPLQWKGFSYINYALGCYENVTSIPKFSNLSSKKSLSPTKSVIAKKLIAFQNKGKNTNADNIVRANELNLGFQSPRQKRSRSRSQGVSIGSNKFGNHDTKSSSPAQLVDKSSELVVDRMSKFYASQCCIQPLKCKRFSYSKDTEDALRCQVTENVTSIPKFSNLSSKESLSPTKSVIAKKLIAFQNQGKNTNADNIVRANELNLGFQSPRQTRSRSRSQNKNLSKVHGEKLGSVINIDHDYSLHHFKFSPENATEIDNTHSLDHFQLPPENAKEVTNENFKIQRILPQFIIPSPPFPYVLDAKKHGIATMCEIDSNNKPIHYVREITVDSAMYINRVISSVTVETRHNPRCSKRISKQSNKIDCTGSVLESIENRVSIKPHQTNITKHIFPILNDVEDIENLQVRSAEKELALTLINKLVSSKVKKRRPKFLICEICKDKKFTAKSTLLNHYYSHADVKRHLCTLCEKTFTRKHSLKYHISIHENKTRFECHFCKRQFRHPSHFKKHLQQKHGEMPIVSPLCKRTFKKKNTFKRHD